MNGEAALVSLGELRDGVVWIPCPTCGQVRAYGRAAGPVIDVHAPGGIRRKGRACRAVVTPDPMGPNRQRPECTVERIDDGASPAKLLAQARARWAERYRLVPVSKDGTDR